MRAPRNRYARKGYLGLANILLVILWLGLWLAWPRAPAGRPGRRQVKVRVVYGGAAAPADRFWADPLLFVASLLRPDRMPEQEAPDVAPAGPDSAPVALLARGSPPPRAGESAPIVSEPPARRAPAYHPPWVESPGPAPKPPGPFRPVVELSATLRSRGFEMPGLAAESLRQPEKAWQATLQVRCDERGEAESVFVVAGSGDPDVDGLLARSAYRGTATPGAPCEGQVTVSYGRE